VTAPAMVLPAPREAPAVPPAASPTASIEVPPPPSAPVVEPVAPTPPPPAVMKHPVVPISPRTRAVPEPPPTPLEPPPATTTPDEPPATPTTEPIEVDAGRLAAEVAILDRARAALRDNDLQRARVALDEHTRDFAGGALVAEAALVRIEVSIRAGDRAAARRAASEFLTRFPRSPLVKRVRSLIDQLPQEVSP
jgi:outer membrane biosynthesis protein TonB